jgi:hypothetical protein
MRFRIAAGLFRLWVVLSVLWLAGAGAYIIADYQDVALHDLKQPVQFDDLIPAYEDCWDYRTSDGKQVDVTRFSDQALAQVAECERTMDRWAILKTGTAIALGIPIAILIVGCALVWAFRGFLPAGSP